ncbi:MAG: hypothetical protein WB626_11090 [Bacteroidota bacterium]
MPFSRKYFPGTNFILTRVHGCIDDAQLLDHVRSLNAEAREWRAAREVADCRDLGDISRLTVQGTTEAARLEKGQPRCIGGRLAIVVPEGGAAFGMGRAYASVAELARGHAIVTLSLSESLRWLGFPEAELTALEDLINAERPRKEGAV